MCVLYITPASYFRSSRMVNLIGKGFKRVPKEGNKRGKAVTIAMRTF